MKFVFWQNVISIHQSAFIKALATYNEVILVAQEKIDAQRIKERWYVPSMGNARVIVNPDEYTVNELLKKDNTEHIFSGINAFPMVYRVFKESVKRGKEVSVIAEPYEWAGIKGLMRQNIYRWLFIKYGKKIKHLFTTGYMGMKCYKKVGFSESKIHQWGYFTEQEIKGRKILKPLNSDLSSDKVKLLYVGRIDKNKNILPILQDMKYYDKNVSVFTVVGDGPLMSELENLSKQNTKIQLLGRLDNSASIEIMGLHDYLILPSLYDGWGAVVNEALAQGTRVLCSNACGAGILLDGDMRGEIFTQKNVLDIIKKHCERGPVSSEHRNIIKKWALNNISGRVAADYFCSILYGDNVEAPWTK